MSEATGSENARVLITGAGGFVGSALLDRLEIAWPSAEILALGAPVSRTSDRVTVATVDVRSEDLDTAIQVFEPTHIVHLAAKSSVSASYGQRVETMNVSALGAIHLADAVRQHTPRARLLFASSGEVYGSVFRAGNLLDEQSPVSPTNPYARAKLAAELLLRDRLEDQGTLAIMRPLNHTGAGQDERFVVPSFARQIALAEAGRQVPVIQVGNLDAERDFMSVDDVVDAYVRVLACDEKPGTCETYNVSSQELRTIRSVLDDLCALSGLAVDVEIDQARFRPTDVARTRLSSEKLRDQTGWRPRSEWRNTLASVLDRARLSLSATA